ncbi:MAG TPA: 6-phosphogluconolactonase, partial [Mycobacteriales bacterium]
MTSREVVSAADEKTLAATIASRLVTALTEAQTAHGRDAGRDASAARASMVLTGGGIGAQALAALATTPALPGLDLGRLDVWWGDERFVAPDDPDRNDVQALAALGGALDGASLHPMGDNASYPDADAAAAAYTDELRAAGGGTVPAFDVLLLGLGPEGHVASIFPQSPAARDRRPVFAVYDCPKPPPTRISLGFGAIARARQVWV